LAYALLNLGEWAAQRNERAEGGWAAGAPPGSARRRAAALFVPLLALAAAGCFTDPINHKPSVTISGPDTPALRQQASTFHASATDPDGDAIHYQWAVETGDCSTPPDASDWQVPPDETTFMVAGNQTNGPFCVWVTATDAHNAIDIVHLSVTPQNQPPTANLKVVSPDALPTLSGDFGYPLYGTIELSALGTDPEGDPLTTIQLDLDQKPGGSTAMITSCPPTTPDPTNASHYCFTADVPGAYDVSYTVSDSQATNKTSIPIHVNLDRPPCIRSSMPDYMTLMQEVTLPPPTNPASDPMPLPTFTIAQVDDDGAPWPKSAHGGTMFRWYKSTDDGQTYIPLSNNDGIPFLPLASTGVYKIGDTVKLRVEVTDGNSTNDAALALQPAQEDVYQPVNGCVQRVTWSIDFR
jgi:hypothetical protein